MKRLLKGAFKTAGIVAGLVALLVPFRLGAGLVFFGAIFVAVSCMLAWSKLDEDPEISDVWPPRENQK